MPETFSSTSFLHGLGQTPRILANVSITSPMASSFLLPVAYLVTDASMITSPELRVLRIPS